MAISLYLLGAAFAGYLVWEIAAILRDPLRSIPGPLITRFTRLWCFQRFYRSHWDEDVVELHRKYGSIVRYAPGQYSISDPSAARVIHSHGGGFDKSDFYETWSPPGTTSLFKEQSNRYHGDLRKRFAAMYSMTSVYSYESGVAECVDLLCRKLEENSGKPIDLSWWMECLAFDSIGIVTYGKRFGFLDEGQDIGGLTGAVIGAFTYGSLMGFFPQLHVPFIAASRFLTKMSRKYKGTGKQYLDSFTGQTIAHRRQDRATDMKDAKSTTYTEGPTSILDKFLDANDSNPAYFTDAHITMGLGANVTAGSDTTSTTTAWALYYLIKNPECMAKLRDEINMAKKENTGPISMRKAQTMTYLNAVIDETLRLFPQTGFGLPRVVPPEGAEICGHFFPGGSVVSINAWAIHYDEENFFDAESFVPERWLTSDPAAKERMNQAYLPFGLGSRTCIGRNIASLVMLKTLPQLVDKFDFELAGDLKDGRKLPTQNIFLIRATEFPAVVRVRQ